MSNKENKKRRRLERHIRNKNKEKAYKEEAWENGKLIEENHNNGPYSPGYTLELGQRLFQIMKDVKEKMAEQEDKETYAIFRFRSYRKKIQDYILHYSPDAPKTEAYESLKRLIETYWDSSSDLWKEVERL
jgi:hypothetical protein